MAFEGFYAARWYRLGVCGTCQNRMVLPGPVSIAEAMWNEDAY